MTSTLKSFGILLVVSLSILFILKFVEIPTAEAARIAILVFAGLPFLDRKFEKVDKERARLPTLDEFSRPPWKVFTLATIGGLAICEGIAGVGGGLSWYLAESFDVAAFSFRQLAVTLIPLVLFVVFCVGFWIGVQARIKAVLTAALVGATLKIADVIGELVFMVVDPKDYTAIYQMQKSDYQTLWVPFVTGTVALAIVCAVGSWVGMQRKQANYLNHLLRSIPPAARATIIEIAHDEAQKAIAADPPTSGA